MTDLQRIQKDLQDLGEGNFSIESDGEFCKLIVLSFGTGRLVPMRTVLFDRYGYLSENNSLL